MPRLLTLVLFFLLLSASPPTFPADMRIVDNGNSIVLEGEIKEGDFEKFLNAVLTGGLTANRVYLASNGGNAAEALRIGRLIRALGRLIL